MTKRKLENGNYAAIDVGSNAVRLLIKRIGFTKDGVAGTKEQLIRVPLRLGTDVFTKGRISKYKEKKLCKLLWSFSKLMKLYDVVEYKACATSAMRDADNGKKVISMLKRKTDIKIHMLSGKEEAKLIYGTHSEFINNKKNNFLYVDVGGGSTEVNLIVDSSLVFTNSYNIGTIRVLSDTVDPEEWTRLDCDLIDLAKKYPNTNILGSGGNINKLYRLVENKDKKQQRMTVSSLKEIHDRMSNLSIEERVKQFNLKYDRADVIVPASHVFLKIADIMSSQYIYVPIIGLSDGIIDDMLSRKIKKISARLGKSSDVEVESEINECLEDSTSSIQKNMVEQDKSKKLVSDDGSKFNPA